MWTPHATPSPLKGAMPYPKKMTDARPKKRSCRDSGVNTIKQHAPPLIASPLPPVPHLAKMRKMTDEDYVGQARSQDPEGTYCGNCGLTNDNADDVGWWVQGGKHVCHKCIDRTQINGER